MDNKSGRDLGTRRGRKYRTKAGNKKEEKGHGVVVLQARGGDYWKQEPESRRAPGRKSRGFKGRGGCGRGNGVFARDEGDCARTQKQQSTVNNGENPCRK